MFRMFAAIVFAFCACAPTFAAPPQTPPGSPEAFLQDICFHYRGSDDVNKGITFDKDSDWRRYFSDDLANHVIADRKAAAKAGDVPAIDGDPFVDAQDWDIRRLAIHIDTQSATAATATVKFENLKKLKTLHIKLVATPKGWRIDDIVWPGTEGTFRGLYKKK